MSVLKKEKNTYYTYYKSPFCEIALAGTDIGLSQLHLITGEEKEVFRVKRDWVKSNSHFKKTIKQLDEYFQGQRRSFELNLDQSGTDFQIDVWARLREIPFGETKTYREIAELIMKPRANRAVGSACGKNPLLLIVPCHRVVGLGGKNTGFAAGPTIKEQLLAFEKKVF